MKRKVKPDLFNVTARDLNWGAIFTGTKAALIRAKLVPPKYRFPSPNGKEGEKYTLPLDHHERYTQAVYGPNFGPIQPTWDARVISWGKDEYEVWAQFNPEHDLNIRERAEQATIALQAALKMVQDIAPRPLSVSIPEAIAKK